MLEVRSPRLRLVALGPALARAVLEDRAAFRARVGALVPDDWPEPRVRALLADVVASERAPGWGAWVIIDASARVVIGDVGFKGDPRGDGSVEIGCSVLPAHRGRGVATDAVRALATWALAQPGVRAVRAETATNPASERVLAKAGFARTGTREETTAWALTRAPVPDVETP